MVAAQCDSCALHLRQQFFAGDIDELLAVDFAQDHAIGAPSQLRKNVLEKIRHVRLNVST